VHLFLKTHKYGKAFKEEKRAEEWKHDTIRSKYKNGGD
jgi:hypothetical protein